MVDPHRLAAARSLALHRRIAERVRLDPALIRRAQARVREWRDAGQVAPYYVDTWTDVLSRPVELVCAFLVDESQDAAALRHVTPFAGIVPARERWRIWRDVRESAA